MSINQVVKVSVEVANMAALDQLNQKLRQLQKLARGTSTALSSAASAASNVAKAAGGLSQIQKSIAGARREAVGLGAALKGATASAGRVNVRGLSEIARQAKGATAELTTLERAARSAARVTSGRSNGLDALARNAKSAKDDLAAAERHARGLGDQPDRRRTRTVAQEVREPRIDRIQDAIRGPRKRGGGEGEGSGGAGAGGAGGPAVAIAPRDGSAGKALRELMSTARRQAAERNRILAAASDVEFKDSTRLKRLQSVVAGNQVESFADVQRRLTDQLLGARGRGNDIRAAANNLFSEGLRTPAVGRLAANVTGLPKAALRSEKHIRAALLDWSAEAAPKTPVADVLRRPSRSAAATAAAAAATPVQRPSAGSLFDRPSRRAAEAVARAAQQPEGRGLNLLRQRPVLGPADVIRRAVEPKKGPTIELESPFFRRRTPRIKGHEALAAVAATAAAAGVGGAFGGLPGAVLGGVAAAASTGLAARAPNRFPSRARAEKLAGLRELREALKENRARRREAEHAKLAEQFREVGARREARLLGEDRSKFDNIGSRLEALRPRRDEAVDAVTRRRKAGAHMLRVRDYVAELKDSQAAKRARTSALESARFVRDDLLARRAEPPRLLPTTRNEVGRTSFVSDTVNALARRQLTELPDPGRIQQGISRRFDSVRAAAEIERLKAAAAAPVARPASPLRDLARTRPVAGDGLTGAATALLKAAAALQAAAGVLGRDKRGQGVGDDKRPPVGSREPSTTRDRAPAVRVPPVTDQGVFRQAARLAVVAGTPRFTHEASLARNLPAKGLKDVVRDLGNIVGKKVAPAHLMTKATAAKWLNEFGKAAVVQRALTPRKYVESVQSRIQSQAAERGIDLSSPFARGRSGVLKDLAEFNQSVRKAVRNQGRTLTERLNQAERGHFLGRGGRILGSMSGGTSISSHSIPEGTRRVAHNHPFLGARAPGGGLSGSDIAAAIQSKLPVHALTDSGSLYSARRGKNAPDLSSPGAAKDYARQIDDRIAKATQGFKSLGLSPAKAAIAAQDQVARQLREAGEIQYRKIARGIEASAIDRAAALSDTSPDGILRRLGLRAAEAGARAGEYFGGRREDAEEHRRFLARKGGMPWGESRGLLRGDPEEDVAAARQRAIEHRDRRLLGGGGAGGGGDGPNYRDLATGAVGGTALSRFMGQSTTGLGLRSIAGLGAVFAAPAALGRSYKVAADFDTMMRELNITQEHNGEGPTKLENLRKEIIKTAVDTEFNQTQMAASAITMQRAGKNADEINQLLRPTAEFASANRLKIEDATEIGLRAIAAGGVKTPDIKDAYEALTNIANTLQTDVAQLGMGGKYGIGALKSAGLSFEEGYALIGTLQSLGATNSTGGTGSRRLVQTMFRDQSTDAKMRAAGFDRREFMKDGKVTDLQGALKKFIEADKASGSKLRELLGTEQAKNAYDLLSNEARALEMLGQAVDKATNDRGLMGKLASGRMDSATGAMARFGAMVERVQNVLAGERGFGPWITRQIERGTSMGDAFADFGEFAFRQADKAGIAERKSLIDIMKQNRDRLLASGKINEAAVFNEKIKKLQEAAEKMQRDVDLAEGRAVDYFTKVPGVMLREPPKSDDPNQKPSWLQRNGLSPWRFEPPKTADEKTLDQQQRMAENSGLLGALGRDNDRSNRPGIPDKAFSLPRQDRKLADDLKEKFMQHVVRGVEPYDPTKPVMPFTTPRDVVAATATPTTPATPAPTAPATECKEVSTLGQIGRVISSFKAVTTDRILGFQAEAATTKPEQFDVSKPNAFFGRDGFNSWLESQGLKPQQAPTSVPSVPATLLPTPDATAEQMRRVAEREASARSSTPDASEAVSGLAQLGATLSDAASRAGSGGADIAAQLVRIASQLAGINIQAPAGGGGGQGAFTGVPVGGSPVVHASGGAP